MKKRHKFSLGLPVIFGHKLAMSLHVAVCSLGSLGDVLQTLGKMALLVKPEYR